MNIIFLLIPLSLVLLAVAVGAFFWAMKHDQFDDLEGPAYSIFNEDDPNPRQRKKQDTVKNGQPQDGSVGNEDIQEQHQNLVSSCSFAPTSADKDDTSNDSSRRNLPHS